MQTDSQKECETMNHKLTGKDIRKQLAGHYCSYIAVIMIIAAVLGFCTVFCGTQLEWTHPLSIIGISALTVTFIIFLTVFIKLLKLRNHRIFRRYGSAELIAARIDQGMKDPRYISDISADSFGLLITADFIVSAADFRNYLELRDARVAQIAIIPEMRPVVLSNNPLFSAAATAGTNYAAEKYQESHNLRNYDMLIIWDDEDVRCVYSVRRNDADHVIQLLSELAPHIKIKETGTI